MIVKALIIILAIAYSFYGNFLVAIILSPLLIFILKGFIEDKKVRDKNDFMEKFKDGMLSVSFALDVGYSIENAFGQAVIELKKNYGEEDLITKEFSTICYRVRANENIEEVIEDFAHKTEIEDIIYFAEVFKYAKRTGGNLIDIIKNTTRQIQEKWTINSEIETMIAAKKLEQTVMSFIPIGIILYLKLASGSYIDPLYGNALGIMVMTVCLAMYGISVALARKIMNIEV